MKSKTLFLVAAICTVLLGAAWTLFPELLLAGWGLGSSSALVYLSRRYAVLFLGYAVILWMAHDEPESRARHAIVTGCFVSTGLMAMMSLFGVLNSTINISGWLAFGLEALLTAGFGSLLFAKEGISLP